ncbi:hypothetical protein QUA08_13745 [Microcoleus sp. T3B2]|uniref:hypothetical protein n=1 Tax=Microcoleus sp. T3B2 TaxID=3055426 RepID=UPI002FD45542
MAKLPTTFQTLDLQGFEFDRTQQYSGISREMVDVACAVLQKNRIGIAVRSVNAALKEIYGIGGSTDIICKLLKEWRADNLLLIKGKSEKDLASVILEAADDGLLDESEIPEEILKVSHQMAIAFYRLAYQKADTSVSGDRMKSLAAENEIMRQQLKDFPQLQMEIGFYKSEYDRQRSELKEAYMNLNKQQLADSEQSRQQLDLLQADRNELQAKLAIAEKRLAEVAADEAVSRDRISEISRLNGRLEAREREISSLHSQVQNLQAAVGEKQVLEAQLEQVRSQLKEASATITNLQTKHLSSSALQVDFDNETLHADIQEYQIEVETLKAQLAETKAQLAGAFFVEKEVLTADLDNALHEINLLKTDKNEALTEIEQLKAKLAGAIHELPVQVALPVTEPVAEKAKKQKAVTSNK